MSNLRNILDQYRENERGLPSYLELCGIEAQQAQLVAALREIAQNDPHGQSSAGITARRALAAVEVQP